MKKVRRKSGPRKEPVAAPKDDPVAAAGKEMTDAALALRSVVGRSGAQLPSEVIRALGVLLDSAEHLTEVSASTPVGSIAVEVEPERERQREHHVPQPALDVAVKSQRREQAQGTVQFSSGPRRSRQGQNHSEGGPPTGYVFAGGMLTKLIPQADRARSERTSEIAKALLVKIGNLFNVPNENKASLSDTRPLGLVIRPLLPVATPRIDAMGGETELARRLEAAFEALTGCPSGDAEWWEGPLESQLEMNARRLIEQQRRSKEISRKVQAKRKGESSRAARRDDVELLGDRLRPESDVPLGALDQPVGPAEIRKFLERVGDGRPLPRELTDTRLQKMIATTNVGGNRGGRGGKKSARAVVGEFKKALRARR